MKDPLPAPSTLDGLDRPTEHAPTAVAGGRWRHWPSKSTWIAAAAGAMVAGLLIAWPSVARWRHGSEQGSPPVKTVAARVTGERNRMPTRPARPLVVETIEAEETHTEPQAERTDEQPWTEEEVQEERPEPTEAGLPEPREVAEVIGLSADDPPLEIASLAAGQTVRGDAARRPVIDVPAEGLVVAADEIAFENVDFIAGEPLLPGRAMLTLHGAQTTFDGCTFDGGNAESSSLPLAIAWNREPGGPDSISGELEIRNTTFNHVATAVGCRVVESMTCRLDNVLHPGPGPFVELDRPPEADEAVTLTLSHVTVRGASSVLSVGCDRLPRQLGQLDVEALDCAFVLRSAAALIVYHGPVRPGPLLAGLHWTGQGSVLSTRSRMALWRMPEGRMLAAHEKAVPIEGVVRGDIVLAGVGFQASGARR